LKLIFFDVCQLVHKIHEKLFSTNINDFAKLDLNSNCAKQQFSITSVHNLNSTKCLLKTTQLYL